MKTNNTPDRQNGEAFESVNDNFSNKNTQAQKDKVAGMHIEWSQEENRVTQMAGLAYFVEFLSTTNLFEHFVQTCPLSYQSNNAPDKRDVLGTLLLSVLSGHSRYAHINALRGSGLDAELLRLGGLPSEDSIRRALRKLVASEATQLQTRSWLSGCFEQLHPGILEAPWILDVDVTVKPLYGNQEGAVRGYNPGKPGRPSHAYHSFWVAHLRLCLDVQVHPGNQTQGAFGLGRLLDWLRERPREHRPEFVRGDISYGTQTWMQQLEDLDVPYLFRLKKTKAVRELIGLIERENDWTQSPPSCPGWSYCESTLKLSGWNRSRRIVVYRRVHRRESPSRSKAVALLPGQSEPSEQLALELVEEALTQYEYAVYVTTLKQPAGQIRPLYNPRGDNENSYDELKNQWGWCGFTLKDLARSELMACLIALVYNWWSLYTKLVEEDLAREAITSRPMYLMHVAKASTHQSMRCLVIFCAHVQLDQIRQKLETAARRLKAWARLTAEQLKVRSLWKRIIGHILSHHRNFSGQKYRAPPMIEAPT
jgi:hypothetical protein